MRPRAGCTFNLAARALQEHGLAGLLYQAARVVAGRPVHAQPHIDPSIQQLPHRSDACAAATTNVTHAVKQTRSRWCKGVKAAACRIMGAGRCKSPPWWVQQ